MSATPIQANALHLPLADASVDLVISSPPYHGLRSYRDGGEHYPGQIGSESHPQEFLEALWTAMREVWRVLKPTGSCFINLGDRRSGSGGHNNSNLAGTSRNSARRWCDTCERHVSRTSCQRCGATNLRIPDDIVPATRRNAPDRYNQAAFGRPKSKMLLPHRFAIGCEDGMADPEGIGWIVRSDMVWSKPNGLPESVVDRVRDSHEFWFHLVKQGRYFSAVDEIREPHSGGSNPGRSDGAAPPNGRTVKMVANGERGGPIGGTNPDLFNPLGKLPGSVWTVASEPLTIPEAVKAHYDLPDHFAAFPQEFPRRLILGWSPSGGVVADIFGGTGTVAGVARQLGRTGISFDLSHDYSRLAAWFLNDGRRFAKTSSRTDRERQGVLL